MAVTGGEKPNNGKGKEENKSNDLNLSTDSAESKQKTIEVSADEMSEIRKMLGDLKRENAELKSKQESKPTENIADIIRATMEGMAKQNTVIPSMDNNMGLLNSDQVDPEDWDQLGVSFFAHNVCYVISDDKRKGKMVSTPYGNDIVFMLNTAEIKGTGRNQSLEVSSKYTSHSKKEQQWMREHRLYGIAFFDNHNKAISINSENASRLARVSIMVNAMDKNSVLQRCTERGITMKEDVQEMRVALTWAMAIEEQNSENKEERILKLDELEQEIFIGSGAAKKR